MASKNRITVALSERQITMLQEMADQAARDEGRAVSPAEIVRRVLAEHFGPDWPDADVTWGGFSPAARRARWARRSTEETMWKVTWERFFGGHITPEEYLAKLKTGELESRLREDLTARWEQVQPSAESEDLDATAGKLADYLKAVQKTLDDYEK